MPTAALVAAGGLQAFGQVAGGIQAQAESRSTAKQLEQQGQVEMTNAQSEISANDIESNKANGALSAGAAASGVSSNSGSVRAVRSMNDSMAILRDTYARYKGKVAENNSYYQARAARFQGNQALYGGLLSGATSLLTSAAGAYGQNKYGGGGVPGSSS